jgi:cytochrome P450
VAEAMWDPAETDGCSEDWLDRLMDLAAEHRVVETPTGFAVLRSADVSALLKTASLKVPVVEQYDILGITGPMRERAKRVILGLDGAPHQRLRKLVNRAFTPKMVAGLGEAMRAFLEDRLDACADSDVIDVLDSVVAGYPGSVIGALLGVPEADVPRLAALADAIVSAQFSLNRDSFEAFARAAAECDAYLYDLVSAKRGAPANDLLSELIATEVDGDRLSDDDIVSISSSVLNAGMDTTRHQSCLALTLFCEHPEQWSLLRERRDLVPNAVEEALRFRPVTPLASRLNGAPLEHDGIEFPAGSFISLAAAAANRDPELNPDHPERFDVTRKDPSHYTFGFGPHFCLGAALARLELVQLLDVMLDRFERIELVGPVPRRPVMGVYGVKALEVRVMRAPYLSTVSSASRRA